LALVRVALIFAVPRAVFAPIAAVAQQAGRMRRIGLVSKRDSPKVDMIGTSGSNATPAAKKATDTIPIVFMGIGADPVASGLDASHHRGSGPHQIVKWREFREGWSWR
jgi:hypothetical protein